MFADHSLACRNPELPAYKKAWRRLTNNLGCTVVEANSTCGGRRRFNGSNVMSLNKMLGFKSWTCGLMFVSFFEGCMCCKSSGFKAALRSVPNVSLLVSSSKTTLNPVYSSFQYLRFRLVKVTKKVFCLKSNTHNCRTDNLFGQKGIEKKNQAETTEEHYSDHWTEKRQCRNVDLG